MMTIYLDQKLSSLEDTHVKVLAVHPGIVKTDLYVNVRYMTVSTLHKNYLVIHLQCGKFGILIQNVFEQKFRQINFLIDKQ